MATRRLVRFLPSGIPLLSLVTAVSLLISSLAIAVRVTAAADLYVSTFGDDANPGTLDHPWRTIQKAADEAAPGSTVYVRGGVYHERVTVNVSGSEGEGYIHFRNYPGEAPVMDGTGLNVPDAENGLFLMEDRSYLIVQSFEIRNYKTTAANRVPVGIHIRGSGNHLRITNNKIHHIEHNRGAASGTDAHGIAVYGTSADQPIHDVIIDGNELYALRLGSSESLVVNGNVDGFRITGNSVHDNNNIGIDAIGFERVSPDPAVDQARNGLIASNHVYNINSRGNPAYGNDPSADGIYVDGGRNIVIERNRVHHCNIGIELASEHQGWATSAITVRNNFVYLNDVTGIAMGGYDARRGNTERCTIVNNTLFRNDRLQWGNGEMILQFNTRNNTIKNNIFFASGQNLLISNPFTQNAGNVVDYNLYFAPGGATGSEWQWKKKWYDSFGAYRSATGNDVHSLFQDPQLVSTNAPNLHLKGGSPAVDAGQNLGKCGNKDMDGQVRIQNIVDIGADEVR